MKFKYIIGFFLAFSLSIFAKEEYMQGKILSILKKEKIENDEIFLSITDFKVEIMDGDEKGKILTISQPTYKEKQYNISLKPKMSVVLYKDTDSYYIIERDRRSSLYVLGFIFVGLTLFITKNKG